MSLAQACRIGLGLMVLAMPALTVAAAPTALSGHVEVAANHQPVAGARVVVREANLSTITDANGDYMLPNVAPGVYTVIVNVKGQHTLQRKVTVDETSPVVENFVFGADVKSLDSVNVNAPVTADVEARALQQQAPNMIFVQPAAAIERLPDVNAGEAVRRLPGISLETDTGEGRFVNIRGLDADLNSTTFDGVRLMPTNVSTPTGGGRAVAFDSIPAGLVGALTVTNTNLPEQDAEALGGTIEISSKTIPKDRDQFLDVQLGTGLENLRDTPVKDYELTGGFRFGPDKNYKPFSFIGTVEYYQDRRAIDDVEAGYVDQQGAGVPDKAFTDIDQRYYNYQRTRHGYGFEFDFQPDDNDKWYARYFDAGYTELKSRQSLTLEFAGAPVADPNNPNGLVDDASYVKSTEHEKEMIDSRVAILGGQNNFGSWRTDYHLSLSIGSYNKPYDYGINFANGAPNPANPDGSGLSVVSYDNISNPNYPSYSVLQGQNPTNPSGYTLNDFSNSSEHDHDQEYSFGDNVTIPTSFFTQSSDEYLKFGVSSRLRTRNNTQQNFDYNPPAAPLSQLMTGQPIVFYDGHYNNGYNINPQAVINLFNANPGEFVENSANDFLANLQSFGHDSENIYAGYGEYAFQPMDKLSLLGGVRYELTNAQYEGLNIVTSNGTLVNYSPNIINRNYGNVFPSLQAKYSFDTDLIGRAVYSKTVARPGFQQVTPSTQVDDVNNVVSQGNPALKPTYSDNFDLSLEYYLPEGGLAYAGLFDKQLTNYIVQTGTIQTVTNPTGILDVFAPGTQVTFSSYENISSAWARGLQLVYVDRFRWLPGALSGLGVNTNFTYVDSRIQIHPGVYSSLPSTSRDTANFSLTYDYLGLRLDLGAYYESKNIFTVGGLLYTNADGTNVYADQYSSARTSLDFGASYAFNDMVSVYFGAKNLTNTKLRFTETAANNRPIQREFYDQTFTAGVRIHL
ncbi:TonB-dependent receptor [Dyella lipolytica]|uniref:TonB-dependent receptor n=1 Tax=Dyella lipolytica TaxID=1867835 RepID=A0ABW8IRU3_9GAMM|nr:TonB-dependent receptor [Dyella lipolytica]